MRDYDIAEIKRCIDIIKPNNQLYEIRILSGSGKRKTIISGYFRGTDNLEEELKRVNLDKAGVFYTLNEIDDDCYSLEQHEQLVRTDSTTSDEEIISYQWLLVDFDPKRKSGISSTDEEFKRAKEKARVVKAYLKEKGFCDPIVAFSGNGMHLLYKIDLPNSEENRQLIANCLSALDYLFTDEYVDIDKSVFNPARISKLYGTVAKKGAHTKERPHRMSKILEVPGEISATERTMLEKLANLAPAEEPKPEKIQKKTKNEFDVGKWLDDHAIGVSKVNHTSDGAIKYVLDECPFDSRHKAPDSMVIVQPSGAIGFRCLHNSCSGHDWHELREKYEPDAYVDNFEERNKRIDEGWKVHKQYIISKTTDDVEEVKKNIPKLNPISAYELQQKTFPETYFAVKGIIPEGETVIAAPPKTGKSWLMLDMCLKVANGEPFLGFDTVKSDTLYLALEDGDKFEQERLNIVCPDDAPKNFHFIFDNVLHLNEGFLFQLDDFFEKVPNTKLVVIDTLNFIQYHPAKNESAYNCDYRTGRDLKAYAEKKGIAIVVVTHTTKMLHLEDEMMNVSGTNGVTGAADAVIVLNKEKRTDHNAKMFITGRKVRQTMHNINFNNQTCIWEYAGEVDEADLNEKEREERNRKYYQSRIRDAVVNIANNNKDGWKGKANELAEEASKYGIGLRESPKEIGGFLTHMLGMFLDCDDVMVEKIKNGTGSGIYKIYKYECNNTIFEN